MTTKKEVVKITKLTLRLNGFPPDISDFIKKQWSIRFGYVKLVKEKKNYAKVKLTDSAYLMADTFEYEDRIVKRTYLMRLIYGIIVFFRAIKKLFNEIIPNFIKRLFSKKSGTLIMKTIGVLSALLGFIWLCIEMFEWAVKKGFIN
ncbi:hypothetical protein [Zunongwangia sp.]|uniref:hypothetical protein n=1 Tax=Zunongwangia sp. TaxID=1965325 RepID=UPI003AA7EF49